MTGQNAPSVSMEYPAPDPNAWWNNNAQLTVVGFGRTKRYGCVFNFCWCKKASSTCFKIEGGGKAVLEAPVVATYVEMQAQSFVDRIDQKVNVHGLNLLIIFKYGCNKTTTLDLYSVEYCVILNLNGLDTE